MCVLGTQKNRLTETVLLSTLNISFGREIRNIISECALPFAINIYNICKGHLVARCSSVRQQNMTNVTYSFDHKGLLFNNLIC